MKIKQPISLLALGTALIATTSLAQTTPTGTATSTTYPQGAIATDSMPAKMSRDQKRAMKRNRRLTNQKAGSTGTTANTSTQDAAYRQSSSSVGTAVNNSNTTNYNSNNVITSPTGVGSNPNSMGTSPTPADQVSNGQNNSAARSSSSSTGGAYSPNAGATDSNAGTAAAVSGAKTSTEPAVKAGSTVRNTSIGDFVSSSPNFITLQNALQSADLWETLKGSGPYTVFAPTNAAFKKLPATVQGGLLEGSNRAALKQLLSCHVVSGSMTAAELTQQIKAGNGKATLKTLGGTTLTVQESNGRMTVTDEQGGKATIDGAGDPQSNGIVYGIDSVLMPKTGMNGFR